MNTETKENITIRRYLLGLTPAAELAAIEEQMLRDGDFYQEILIGEDDLVDEYLAEKLSNAELEAFQSNFMTTDERREKLRFSKAFKTYLTEAATPVPAASSAPAVDHGRKWYQSFFLPENRVLAFAATAVLLAAVLTLSFLAFRSSRSSTSGGPAFAIPLSSGITRGDGDIKRVSIPKDHDLVRFQLGVGDNPSTNYKAELISEGKSLKVWDRISASVTPNGRTVALEMPAGDLQPGDYRIRLSSVSEAGETANAGTFPVRITR